MLHEGDVREFIRKLPELSPDSVHLLMLAVRSRHAREIMGFKIKDLLVERKVMRQFISQQTEWGTAPLWRDAYFDVVNRYDVLKYQSPYHVRNIIVPPDSMAIYGTLSPRDVQNAVVDIMKENIQLMHQNDTMAKIELAKQSARFFGALHRHRHKGNHFITLDIDVMDSALLKDVIDMVSSLPVWMVTKTGRGFHVILDLSKPSDSEAFHKPGSDNKASICNTIMQKYKDQLELQRDSQEPIPGTSYGKGHIEIIQ